MTVEHERQHLPYTPAQMFALVADVERYPAFVPWLLSARIVRREGSRLWVEMTVRSGPLRKRFTSVANLEPPHRIAIGSRDPLFEKFEQVWQFEPAENGGTIVTYLSEFRFRSRLLQALMGAGLSGTAADLVRAFRHRARRLYGHS